MALEMYKKDLSDFIVEMQKEGLVSGHFAYLQSFKESVCKDYVVRQVVVYSVTVKNLFICMSTLLEKETVDFSGIEIYANELFDKSNRMGAELVRIASAFIGEACRALDKENCARWLVNAKSEFSKLQRKFETLLELERKIINYEAGYDTRVLRLKRWK